MKILITGCAGYIGKNLMLVLMDKGHQITVLDRLFGHDLSDRELLKQNVEESDLVIHLAAVADLNYARTHPQQTFKTNIEGTWNVAEFCAKYQKRLLYASTCCVYGDQNFKKFPETTEESPPNPNEIYAYSKYMGELLIKSFHFTHGLRYVNMRFPTTYGEPGMREALGVKIFFRQAMRNQPITVHGDGTQTRTLTDISDLIEAITRVVDKSELNNMAINLSTEQRVSALDMAVEIKNITGSESKITFIPQRPGQTMKEKISSQKAKDLLGWKAETKFVDGLKKVYEALKREEEKK